jgi:hypothetical protein
MDFILQRKSSTIELKKEKSYANISSILLKVIQCYFRVA